jgi:hypothetical protein
MNTSKLNEIKTAGANTRYLARGMPAFVCLFVSKTAMKWQRLATPTYVASHEKSQRMKPFKVSRAGFVANKFLL